MKKYLMLKMIALFAVILCFGIANAWAAELYVDASAAAGGDGTSWTDAFNDLQDALAVTADGETIHVAQGIYIPGDTPDASFVLDRNLTLLGGYPSGGGDRNPSSNQTILSGEIGDTTSLDNIYHVVSIYDPSLGLDMAVTMDGFTITRGIAREEPYNTGGGMFVNGGSHVTLINLNFYRNGAVGGGAGLKFSGESLTLNNVNFDQNRTEGGGGGLLFTGGDLIMNYVDFSRNIAGANGGGLHFSGVSTMNLNDVNFFGNTAFALSGLHARGGGIYIASSRDGTNPLNMTNMTLSGNAANGNDYAWGGGIYVASGPEYHPIALTNVTLSNNQANGTSAMGGGICFGFGGWRWMTLTNVTLSGNQANGVDLGQGGGMFLFPSGDVVMTHVTVSDNLATGEESALGGGVFAVPYVQNFPGQMRTTFRNSIFWGNEPDQLQGVYAYWCIVEGGYDYGYENFSEDPMLGTLGNYGGFTQTIPLLEGSSAIDTAIPEIAPDTDQRGISRPQGAGFDIGAYEASTNLGEILIDPSGPVAINTMVQSEASFSDSQTVDTHTAVWIWGDGNSSEGIIDMDNGIVTGDHSYAEPGVYTVALEISNSVGDLLNRTGYQYVVVYDPAAGFVTGGGWFNSPAGAYKNDPSLEGPATFGFVSRYKKGATVPSGNTVFEFQTGDLYFQSTTYDWLVVTGSDYARFKGSGTINGGGDYKFMLWAGDSEQDTFRIRIWEEDEETAEEIGIYDNGFDQAIGGGSIVIHAK